MVEPFSVDSQLELIFILSRAVRFCEWTCVHGGYPLESCAEGTVKIPKIKTKALNTAEIQCFAMSHTDITYIKNSVNEEVNTLLFDWVSSFSKLAWKIH